MIEAQFNNDRDPTKALDGLKKAVQNKIVRRAIRSASAPVKKAIKQQSPKESGALKKSIANKMRTTKGGAVVYNVLGPKRKYSMEFKGKIRKPEKYARLVEKGTKSAAAHPFMEQALENSQRQYFADVTEKIVDGLKEELH